MVLKNKRRHIRNDGRQIVMKRCGVADNNDAFLGVYGGHESHVVIALKDEFKIANLLGSYA